MARPKQTSSSKPELTEAVGRNPVREAVVGPEREADAEEQAVSDERAGADAAGVPARDRGAGSFLSGVHEAQVDVRGHAARRSDKGT